jgi:putative hemolysin
MPLPFLVVIAVAAALAAMFVAFAQYALLASQAEHEEERPPGEDYADAALVTRLLENPRGVYLQLSALRTLLRSVAFGGVLLAALPYGAAAAVPVALAAALVLWVLEEELSLRVVLRDPPAWSLRLLPPLALVLRVLRAGAGLFELVYDLCRAIVRTGHRRERPMSVEELTMMAAAGGAGLGIEERRILRGIFRSSGILVADIRTPRDRVVAIEAGTTVGRALEIFRETRHSRLPVYEETLDHVIGMAHAKDFLRSSFATEELAGSVRPHLRDAYFVRQDRRIHELFDEVREGKIHLAVVVDRMGRTTGIVSLDDILEEIVGEIHDELELGRGR